MRKVFLDELPRTKNDGISWKDSCGYKVKFIYDDIEGEIEILDRIGERKLKIKYDNEEYEIDRDGFKSCQLGRILNIYTGDFKLNIGDILRDDKRDITIIDREYRKREKTKGKIEREKWYKYKCNKCLNEDWINESCLLNQNQGCNVCCMSSHKIVKGVNDIATTNPWMMKYLVDLEDGYNHSKCSKDNVEMKCPYCGNIVKRKILYLYSNGFVCKKCGDGISYPNKFMFNMLQQMGLDFETEYSPDWLLNRKFDFYIPSINLIIEMDGGLGHGNKIHTKSRRYISKEDSKNADDWKDEQARKHNISVIRINCNYPLIETRFEFIKNNVLNSQLNSIFNLNAIEWDEIYKYCAGNLVKEICEYQRKHEKSIEELSDIFKLGKTTLRRYLKIGDKLGWCKYNGSKTKKRNSKIIEVYYNNTYVDTYESISYIERNSYELFNFKMYRNEIIRVYNGKRKDYNGYTFKIIS